MYPYVQEMSVMLWELLRRRIKNLREVK